MVRYAVSQTMARGLEQFQVCKPHGHRLCIVGRGPSAEDTIKDMRGYIAAVNHAHDWLISKGVKPNACGLIDPVPWLADHITPQDSVVYFVASMCHGLVFDKLKGKRVVVWHASQGPDYPIADLVPEGSPLVAGATSMLLRWLDLGYLSGFRSFDIHGFDCSYKGERHHVDELDQSLSFPREIIDGYGTWAGWLHQINDFFLRMERFRKDAAKGEMDPIEITVHGDGLFQHIVKREFGGRTVRIGAL